jgi:hypothetical protein
MNYKRPILSTLRTYLSSPTPVIHVLIGPRQVGKTTIARQIQEFIGIPTNYATADSPVPLDSAWIEPSLAGTYVQFEGSKQRAHPPPIHCLPPKGRCPPY